MVTNVTVITNSASTVSIRPSTKSVASLSVITNSASTVSIRPSTKSVASLSAIPSSNISLGSLANVDVANIANGQSLVYNSATGKFEANEVRASQPTTLIGGSF